jgi:alcohol dehydrogenase
MMRSFQHVTPPLRLFHGSDSLAQLGKELDRVKATRAVIFCGGTLAREGTLVGRVQQALGARFAGAFTEVRAHSPIPSVEAAAQELRRLGADAAVAIGGGSAIVTARAASILAAEEKPVRELCTVQDGKGGLISPRLVAPKIPQFVIPTTPSSAGVKAGSAVFDPADGERRALFDPKTRAQAIFVDPGMLASASRTLVANAGVNSLATAVEGLMSRTGNPMADAPLMHAVRLFGRHLADAERLGDPEVRGELMLAALLCGQGTDHTGAGITTVLGHAIGARHHIDNGIVNAIVMPHVLAFNADAAPAGLGKVAAALGASTGDGAEQLAAVIAHVRKIATACSMPSRLRDVGVPADALPAIAEIGLGDWFLRGNPRPVTEAGDLLSVLEKAW